MASRSFSAMASAVQSSSMTSLCASGVRTGPGGVQGGNLNASLTLR